MRAHVPEQGPPAFFNHHSFFTSHLQPVLGGLALLLALPYVALQIVMCTAWHALDARALGCGAALRRVLSWRGWDALVKHKGDGFIAPALAVLGFALPLLCVHEALHARAHGFTLWRALAYNLLRIGPMYVNFAHLYTLAHKESHAYGAVFSPLLNRLGAGYAFNWVAGPFFGVLPGTFTHSHQLNHHRYHNGVSDVYSTGGFPRDSLWSFCRYFFVWLLYASNLSTLHQLVAEGRTRAAVEVVGATMYYLALVGAVAAVSPAWAAASMGWAFVEGNVLLAMVNWVWHAFIDPADPTNPFIVSTTIVRGQEFIFSEEYHAVHHAKPGLHWSKYEAHFEGERAQYAAAKAVLLQDANLFVVWGMIVAGDYAGLAGLVHDPAKKWDAKALPGVLRARLRHTIW